MEVKTLAEVESEEMVKHPPHYTQGNIEVIDFIDDQKLGYHLGNAIKYICRCRFKGHKEEDLKKAIWYLERELTHPLEMLDKE